MPLHFIDPAPDEPKTRPVLLLHGLGSEGSSWQFQFPALIQAKFHPLAPDLPGFGQSPYHGREWSLKKVALLLTCWLTDNNIESVAVVGISMGGVIAQLIAIQYPSLVNRLVLVNTFASIRPRKLNTWLYLLNRYRLAVSADPEIQAQLVAEKIFPDPGNSELRQIFIQQILQCNPAIYRKAMRQLVFFNSTRRLYGIRCPTLVISGENDTTVPIGNQIELVRRIPNARHVVIPKAGHAVTVDQPVHFNKVLIGFLWDQ